MTLIFPPHQNFITRRHNTSTKLHKTPHYQDPTIPYITSPLPCASHHNITPQYDTSTKLHKTPHYQNISLRHNTHTWRYLTTTTQLVTHTIPQPYKTSRYSYYKLLNSQYPYRTIPHYASTSRHRTQLVLYAILQHQYLVLFNLTLNNTIQNSYDNA